MKSAIWSAAKMFRSDTSYNTATKFATQSEKKMKAATTTTTLTKVGKLYIKHVHILAHINIAASDPINNKTLPYILLILANDSTTFALFFSWWIETNAFFYMYSVSFERKSVRMLHVCLPELIISFWKSQNENLFLLFKIDDLSMGLYDILVFTIRL